MCHESCVMSSDLPLVMCHVSTGLTKKKHGIYIMCHESCVMSSLMCHESCLRFDLKGSTLGRFASDRDKAKGARAILKDMDLVNGNYKVLP